ncbi:MAG: 4Fe-4S dicluster domain-containing protein [Eggerthellaceae bacterium]|nr:4Fe-4S dicluster domain-containing protein [Eggerthellaceae bacterium]
MGQLGFYFNQDDCVGCHTCQIACKDYHNLEIGVLYRNVESYETGDYPTPGLYHYAKTCNHCERPLCVASCPSGAMYIAEDGTVQQDPELCIGDKACVDACPYGVPQYLPATMKVGKCDACAELRAEGHNPACIDACNMRVLEFGALDELRAKHPGKQLVSDLPILPSSSQTGPSTIIYPRACALEASYKYLQEI